MNWCTQNAVFCRRTARSATPAACALDTLTVSSQAVEAVTAGTFSAVARCSSEITHTDHQSSAENLLRIQVSRTLPVTEIDPIPRSAFGKFWLWLTICWLLLTPSGFAQERDSGKEVVRGLLRALVESQLDREQGRAELRAVPRPGQNPGQVTVEISQLRPVIASCVQELATLTTLLNTDSRRSFEVRRSLADALQVQATAAALKHRTDSERDHRILLPGYRALNAEWKTLSWQLQAMSGISSQTRQCIARIDKLDTQYSGILNLQEQFDSRELVRAAESLAAEYRVLADEVSYAQLNSGNRPQLVLNLRRLRDRSQTLANMIADKVPSGAVVSEYRALYQVWQQIRPDLNQVSSRTVVRAMARVQETHRTLHQLLRLEFGADQDLLLRLAQNIQRELSDLFRSITLEQMMVLRDYRAITESADALAGSAENLTDVVTRKENMNVIGEAWFFLDEAWRVFEHYVEPLQVSDMQRRLDGVRQSIQNLNSVIGVTVAFDQNLVIQQAAALQSLADRLQVVVRRWHARPGSHDRTVLRDTDTLKTRCRELELLCHHPKNQSLAQAKCDEVILLWQQLRPGLLNCTTEDRDSVENLTDSITPELVRLRMMLGDG